MDIKTIPAETATNALSCKLTTPQLQQRKATVIAELKGLVLKKRALDNGFSYAFDGSDAVLSKILDFIKSERMCCDFFTFQLTIQDSSTVLTITGPEGAKEFLKEEVNL